MFYFRLASLLGCTVSELLEKISSSELSEWMAFYSMEPFGFESQMLGHAVTSSTIANVNRQKGQKSYAPKDFVPRIGASEQVDKMIELSQILSELSEGNENGDSC